jgi:glycine C-acetyltransferase
VIDYIKQKARPNLFSSALTPADTAACMAAIEYVDDHPELVEKLWQNAETFKAGIKKLGLDTGRTETPIVPVMLGDVKLAKAFSAQLFENGVFAMALGFPTVPRGQARIRVMNTAAHTQEDLDFGLAAFERTAKQLGVV